MKATRFFAFVVSLALTLSALGITPVRAAGTLFVKPDGIGNCSSWGTACALQTALTNAVNGDEIWVMAGTHKPTTGTDRAATFQLKDGVAIYGGFVGTEISHDQHNPAVNVTILSGEIGAAGNSDNSYHVVTGASGATLDGFTITAGNANGAYPNNRGGGIYNLNSSSPMLANITLSGNSAAGVGGGMCNEWGSNPTLMNLTFIGNYSAGSGGGMYNYEQSNPMLTNATFSGNSSQTWGGGMSNSYSSPTLTNVTFSGNSANKGGGMYNFFSSPTLTNITFSGNSAAQGGGMYNDDKIYPALTNIVFSGGMRSSPSIITAQISNTIFWANTAPDGAQIYNNDFVNSISNLSNSVVQDGCPAVSTCTNIIITDPMLGVLGNYGGSTQTIPLLAGSSAIDTGNDAICPATDQRGITRPQGAHCDIGAYEANPTLTFKSAGAQDGWVLESIETSNKGGTMNSTATTLRLGDDAAKKQYRGILSFNTGAGLPDAAIIIKVTLKVKKQSITGGGNPLTTFKGFMVDIKKGTFGTATLQASDFQAAASKSYGPFKPALVGGWYSMDLTSGKDYINKLSTLSGLTQIRLRFKLDDNKNAVANYLSLFSGNAPVTSRPQLIIEYYVP